MTNRKQQSLLNRVLALALTLAVALGNLTLISGLFREELAADAATAGTYNYRIAIITRDSVDVGDNANPTVTLFYKGNNGASSTESSFPAVSFPYKWAEENGEHEMYIDDVPGFATKLQINIVFAWTLMVKREWKYQLKAYVYNFNDRAWVYLGEKTDSVSGGSGGQSNVTVTFDNLTTAQTKPKATSVTAIQGDSYIPVPKNGVGTTVSNPYQVGTVRDQYGVLWYQAPTLSKKGTWHGGVTFNESSRTISVAPTANADDYYEVTLQQTCGAATSEKEIMIGTFDYLIDFYDETGENKLIDTQAVYYNDNTYTVPETDLLESEKTPTDSVHYVFDGWKAFDAASSFTPGEPITGGQQTRRMKASFREMPHTMKEDRSSAEYRASLATCTQPAVWYKSCSYENCAYCDVDQPYEYGNPLGHNFSASNARIHPCDSYDDPEQADDTMTHNWMCSRRCGVFGMIGDNGEQIEDGVVPCEFGNWTTVVKATCTVGGVNKRVCKKCGNTDTMSTAPTGHNWVQNVSNRHIVSPANCVSPAVYHVYCSHCGENHPTDTFEDGVALSNRHPELVHAEPKSADCTEDGNDEYWYCATCDQYFADANGKKPFKGRVLIPAKGHDFTALEDRLNILGDGMHNWKCKRCDAYGAVIDGVHTADAVVPCVFSEWEGDLEISCTTGGEQSRTCYECGYTETRILEQREHEFTAEEIKESALKVAATCTEPAVYYYSCVYCSEVTEDAEKTFNDGTPLGHDFTGGCANVETGRHNYKCSRCNVYGVGTGENAEIGGTEACRGGKANCVSPAACEKCRMKYGEIDPAAHKNLRHVAPAEPTCLVTGNMEYWFCNGCGKYYSDEEALNEIGQNDVIILKRAHEYAGDARDDGNGMHTYACLNGCGKFGNPTQHTWDSGTVTLAPTCTAKGERTYLCTAEGCTAGWTEEIPALGHSYGAWQPNGAENHIRVCANDASHTETASHNWDEGAYPEGLNCLTGGTIVYTCADCGMTKTKQAPVGVGHVWGPWETVKEGSDAYQELQRATCTVCGAITERVVPVDYQPPTEPGNGGGASGFAALWQAIVNFFSSIVAFFQNLFGR